MTTKILINSAIYTIILYFAHSYYHFVSAFFVILKVFFLNQLWQQSTAPHAIISFIYWFIYLFDILLITCGQGSWVNILEHFTRALLNYCKLLWIAWFTVIYSDLLVSSLNYLVQLIAFSTGLHWGYVFFFIFLPCFFKNYLNNHIFCWFIDFPSCFF
jgi:hypothetical protein